MTGLARGAANERRSTAPGRTALWIARRYLFARSHGYATLINWVSFVGLALGVAILTVVVSVMNGFDREITSRVLSAVPHAVVTQTSADAPDFSAVLALDGVRHVSRFFRGEAMLVRGGSVDFIALDGVDAGGAERLQALLDAETTARLLGGRGGIVLGAALADGRGIELGDPVLLVVATPSGVGVRPRIERFELAGTFAVGAEVDAALGIVLHDEVVRRSLAAAGTDGWRLHLVDPIQAPNMADDIRAALGTAAHVRFWMDDYGELFRAVKIEKAMMFALLALIVAIAAFNIVSGQAMLVNDKRGDIAMLGTMGASRRLLVWTFFLQGFAVVCMGVATGLAVGVAIAVNADAAATAVAALIGASIIEGTWFTEIPSQILASDLVTIAALSLGLSVLAVLVPALKAIAENPAEALHSA